LPLYLWRSQPHDLIGYAIRFLLIGIARRVDRQLALQQPLVA